MSAGCVIILGNDLEEKIPQEAPDTNELNRNVRKLSQQVLLCAKKLRPSVDFLVELSEILVTFAGCDALELWLMEKDVCSRWEATRKPARFYRLGNKSCEDLEPMIVEGLSCTDNPQQTRLASYADDHRSLVSVPLTVGDEIVGMMLLKSKTRGFFDRRALDVFRDVSPVAAISLAYHRVQLEQRERVKELTCLYEIARTAANPQSDVNDILTGIVHCIPPAWQYPDLTAARIVLDGREFSQGNFNLARHVQSSDIVVGNVNRGVVAVAYLQDRPEMDEGPFLIEERRLIDTIAREVASIIERKRAEEDRTKLQEQLLHADRLATIGQLAAGVAHELNEPLGGILGFAQLASKHPETPGQVLEDLSKIESASLHAREVVRKLMLFARQTLPTRKKINLNELVEEGLYFLDSRCVKAGIKLKRRLSEDLPAIEVDPAQIHQVLINLVVNAIQSMETGGTLTVETFPQDESIGLKITDTGCGMTKDVGEGTGLGLPVVHGIVTSHGGTIEVDSLPRRGTRFTILLPLALEAVDVEGEQEDVR
jgi:two-component system NtrC family sensor kinase